MLIGAVIFHKEVTQLATQVLDVILMKKLTMLLSDNFQTRKTNECSKLQNLN